MKKFASLGLARPRSIIPSWSFTGCTMRPTPRVRPDHLGVRMAEEQIPELRHDPGFLAGFGNGMSMSLCRMAIRPASAGEIEDAVEGRVEQAGRLAGDLRRHELLVDRELADAREHAGERQQHALDVIGGVHVRRIEPRDHGVEARLLRRRQRPVLHRDERVGERVVVERRVALQVVGRREIAGVVLVPHLLERDAEDGHAADLRAHDLQEVVDVRAPPGCSWSGAGGSRAAGTPGRARLALRAWPVVPP